MIVKVCGMTDSDNILKAVDAGADIIGMIFYAPSPRCIHSVPAIPCNIRRFGVFVNDSIDHIVTTVEAYRLHGVQLHGSESPDYLTALSRHLPNAEIAKVLSISTAEDFEKADDYASVASMLVFDTKCASYGGSGVKFPWSLLESYHGKIPFLLSGGISPADAEAISKIKHPKMLGIDLNSRFELSPGIKDINKLKLFISQVKK